MARTTAVHAGTETCADCVQLEPQNGRHFPPSGIPMSCPKDGYPESPIPVCVYSPNPSEGVRQNSRRAETFPLQIQIKCVNNSVERRERENKDKMGRIMRSAHSLFHHAALSREAAAIIEPSLQQIKLFDITGVMGARRLFANDARFGLLGGIQADVVNHRTRLFVYWDEDRIIPCFPPQDLSGATVISPKVPLSLPPASVASPSSRSSPAMSELPPYLQPPSHAWRCRLIKGRKA